MKQGTGLRQFSRHFSAMGTDVGVWVWNTDEQRAQSALLAVEHLFVQTELRLSRFRPESELSRLNRGTGRPFTASPLLYDLVKRSLMWREQTNGIFDPAVLKSLIASGYDRPFSQMAMDAQAAENIDRSGATLQQQDEVSRSIDSSGIVLEPQRQITLPVGLGLDLGGIAKGWTIQQSAHRLGMTGACLVDAGGDIACVGSPPGEPWVIPVADPLAEDKDIAVLSLKNAAVATSSRAHRRWLHEGQLAHHLIDPRTGMPAVTNILSVTVVASRLPDAEIYAKTALILGEEQGVAYLDALSDVSFLLVTADGRHVLNDTFKENAYVPSHDNFADRFQTQA